MGMRVAVRVPVGLPMRGSVVVIMLRGRVIVSVLAVHSTIALRTQVEVA